MGSVEQVFIFVQFSVQNILELFILTESKKSQNYRCNYCDHHDHCNIM